MYQKIKALPTSKALYAQRLIDGGVVTELDVTRITNGYRDHLDNGEHVVKSLVREPDTALYFDWTPFLGHKWTDQVNTSISISTLTHLGKRMDLLPENFVPQRQVAKILQDRNKMTQGAMNVNWGYAEVMAYATLLHEGFGIRVTGQDVGRGTFSHRHAVVHNQKDGVAYIPLQHLVDRQPKFDLYDSYLSEEAVLAFEYGYATTNPEELVVWEAQFGDFANGAQVVIDQFITSGEYKWGRLCGLTLLLPHGYEGQGPEHSSARLERFLQLCAENNIQVCVPTTPAQIFHMLRRQVKRPLRKPLITMTPKSLLRHKLAVSTLDELATGRFYTVLADPNKLVPENRISRAILCSGKLYYDLDEKRRQNTINDAAIIRIEQLYPFPADDLFTVLRPLENLTDIVWCQEEPMNQGAWYCIVHELRAVAAKINSELCLQYAGRSASAAPAAGFGHVHVEQQNKLVKDAFTIRQT